MQRVRVLGRCGVLKGCRTSKVHANTQGRIKNGAMQRDLTFDPTWLMASSDRVKICVVVIVYKD